MSEYRRLISYLYSYNNGLKNKNVGFVKAERKNGVIKLWINLKGAFSPEEGFKVYFFTRKDNMIAGIEMGSLEIKNGSGEFKSVCYEKELGIIFEELCGLYIKGNYDGKLFASQWDDRSFYVDKIVLLKDIVDQKKVEEEKVVVEQTEKPLVPVWELPIKEEVYIPSMTDLTEELLMAQEVHETPLKSEEIMEAAMEPRGYQTLFKENIKRDVFSDDDFFDCVDISIEDIALLPENAKNLASNSFVNHAYFNFRHLILGKTRNPKAVHGIVVGVPGVFNRREKMTANMFGFDQFKFSMRSDVHMAHFGYWYREY